MAEAKTSQVLEVPDPPVGTPESIRAEWKRVYGEKLRRGIAPAIKEFEDSPGFVEAARAERKKRPLDPLDPKQRAELSLSYLPARAVSNVHNAARMEANKLLKVSPPANYAEALALADWQVLVREEREVVEKGAAIRKLVGVTIEGAKFNFPVSTEQAAAAQ